MLIPSDGHWGIRVVFVASLLLWGHIQRIERSLP